MEGDQPAQVTRDAVAALIGLSSVSATTQEGTELRVGPQSVDGFVIRALVPRLSLVGVQTVKLRWSVAGKPWVADAVLDDAEFHSTEQAIGSAPSAGAIIACRGLPGCLSEFVNSPGWVNVPRVDNTPRSNGH